MSKASEWAARVKAAPEWKSERMHAYCIEPGRLSILSPLGGYSSVASASDAIALAHWILDTFGEEKSA